MSVHKCFQTFRFGVHEHQGQFHGDVTGEQETSQSEKGLNCCQGGRSDYLQTLLTLQ